MHAQAGREPHQSSGPHRAHPPHFLVARRPSQAARSHGQRDAPAIPAAGVRVGRRAHGGHRVLQRSVSRRGVGPAPGARTRRRDGSPRPGARRVPSPLRGRRGLAPLAPRGVPSRGSAGAIRPMGPTTRTFYRLYARAERHGVGLSSLNLMFETIGSTDVPHRPAKGRASRGAPDAHDPDARRVVSPAAQRAHPARGDRLRPPTRAPQPCGGSITTDVRGPRRVDRVASRRGAKRFDGDRDARPGAGLCRAALSTLPRGERPGDRAVAAAPPRVRPRSRRAAPRALRRQSRRRRARGRPRERRRRRRSDALSSSRY